MFMTVRGGLARAVEALRQSLFAVDIRTGTRVTGVELDGRGFRLRLAGGGSETVDGVLMALPAFASAGLLEPVAGEAAEALAEIPYASTATVALAYRSEDVDHPMDGTGFIVPEQERRTITACTWVSRKWPQASPPDRALIRCYAGRFGDDRTAGLNDEELVEAVRRDLATLMGLGARPVLERVYRWPHGMPQYTVGHLDRVRRIEQALAGLPALEVAGSAFRGVGLPDCVLQGTEAADRLATALGVTPA